MSLYSKLLPDIERQSDADRPAGGEGGIRTHGTLLEYTRSPGVPIQPALAPLRALYDPLDKGWDDFSGSAVTMTVAEGEGFEPPRNLVGP